MYFVNVDELPSKEYILEFLRQRAEDPPTTMEIMEYVTAQDATCKDKIPLVLRKLEREGIIYKKVSPQKRGFTWMLR